MTAKMTFFKTKLSPIFFDGSMNLFMSYIWQHDCHIYLIMFGIMTF